jgi:hypothetical protein
MDDMVMVYPMVSTTAGARRSNARSVTMPPFHYRSCWGRVSYWGCGCWLVWPYSWYGASYSHLGGDRCPKAPIWHTTGTIASTIICITTGTGMWATICSTPESARPAASPDAGHRVAVCIAQSMLLSWPACAGSPSRVGVEGNVPDGTPGPPAPSRTHHTPL